MLEKIKAWFYKRKMLNIQQFCHNHHNFLVIVCDPRDNVMFVSYRGKQVGGKIKSEDGKDHKVVKNVLKHSTFEREIDRLIGAIMVSMKLPLEWGRPFFEFIDGAIFKISENLKIEKDNR